MHQGSFFSSSQCCNHLQFAIANRYTVMQEHLNQGLCTNACIHTHNEAKSSSRKKSYFKGELFGYVVTTNGACRKTTPPFSGISLHPLVEQAADVYTDKHTMCFLCREALQASCFPFHSEVIWGGQPWRSDSSDYGNQCLNWKPPHQGTLHSIRGTASQPAWWPS